MKLIRVLAFFIAPLFLLSGCASSQMYAKNKEEGVYFTIPNGWKKISNSALNSREAKSTATDAADLLSMVKWQEAYSQNGDATAADVFSIRTPKSPLVFVRVRNLSIEETQSVSYNSLRDIILPVTSWIDKGNVEQSFALESDVEAVAKNARGVHTIYSFVGSDGVDQTVNQTALVSDDRTKLYVLLVRAATKKYSANRLVLNKIVNSFTIRGAK